MAYTNQPANWDRTTGEADWTTSRLLREAAGRPTAKLTSTAGTVPDACSTLFRCVCAGRELLCHQYPCDDRAVPSAGYDPVEADVEAEQSSSGRLMAFPTGHRAQTIWQGVLMTPLALRWLAGLCIQVFLSHRSMLSRSGPTAKQLLPCSSSYQLYADSHLLQGSDVHMGQVKGGSLINEPQKLP